MSSIMARREYRLTEIFRTMENYERPADMRELLIHQSVCEEMSELVDREMVHVTDSIEAAWEFVFGEFLDAAHKAASRLVPEAVLSFIMCDPDTEDKRQMLEGIESPYDYVTVTDPANELDELHVLVGK